MTDVVRDDGELQSAVLLCADLDALGHGLDLHEVCGWLQATEPRIQARVVSDLCHRPGKIPRAAVASGVDRLVLGLCSRDYALSELQAQVRRAGLDPLGVEVVNLGAYAARVHLRPQATQKTKILLAAAVAKVRVFPGSRPENLKPLLPAVVSRRGLFSLSLLEYQTAPGIVTERCRVEHGCQICVRSCPHEALRVTNGAIRLEKPRCTGCGVCVTACPYEAVTFPGYAPAQLGSQVAALLGSAPGDLAPRGVLFVCHNSASALQSLAQQGVAYRANWLPVELPCLGMVSPLWLLGCLTLGAAAVGVLPCADGCRSGRREEIEGGVAYCQEVLRLFGEGDERIRLFPATEQDLIEALDSLPENARFLQISEFPDPFAYRSRARVLLQLTQGYTAEAVSLGHPHSPFGVIEVSAGCTTCGGCATACPAGALALEQGEQDVALTFDAALCTACGQCLPACPEAGVLRLHRVTDLQQLARGRFELFQDRYRRCEACGRPIAPEGMLRRIAALLSSQPAAAVSVISRYCADCRNSAPLHDQPRYADGH